MDAYPFNLHPHSSSNPFNSISSLNIDLNKFKSYRPPNYKLICTKEVKKPRPSMVSHFITTRRSSAQSPNKCVAYPIDTFYKCNGYDKLCPPKYSNLLSLKNSNASNQCINNYSNSLGNSFQSMSKTSFITKYRNTLTMLRNNIKKSNLGSIFIANKTNTNTINDESLIIRSMKNSPREQLQRHLPFMRKCCHKRCIKTAEIGIRRPTLNEELKLTQLENSSLDFKTQCANSHKGSLIIRPKPDKYFEAAELKPW